jgi:cytidylate kinase
LSQLKRRRRRPAFGFFFRLTPWDVKKITIAIDGYSSCGKSTLAKALARSLHYMYIDSGAMYRAATLRFLEKGIDLHDESAVREALSGISISFREDDSGPFTLLNGQEVEEAIRDMRVSHQVSQVAAIPAVRKILVAQQRRMGQNKGIVMDGRDIGTVVFPLAELKIFLVADMEVRVRRRIDQLRAQGRMTSDEEVRQNLAQRDHIDSTRQDSPLAQAPDAIRIDNTNLKENEQLAMVLALAKARLEAAPCLPAAE